jgi:hypothetical protein
MDALLLLSAEFFVLGIAIWVVMMDAKPADDVSRLLDMPARSVAKKRFGNTAILRPLTPRRFRRPGAVRP